MLELCTTYWSKTAFNLRQPLMSTWSTFSVKQITTTDCGQQGNGQKNLNALIILRLRIPCPNIKQTGTHFWYLLHSPTTYRYTCLWRYCVFVSPLHPHSLDSILSYRNSKRYCRRTISPCRCMKRWNRSKRATMLKEIADKNIKLAQHRYKKQLHCHASLDFDMQGEVSWINMNRPLLSQFATK